MIKVSLVEYGELFVGGSSCSINQLMIDKHHVVPYDWSIKRTNNENHLKNRQRI